MSCVTGGNAKPRKGDITARCAKYARYGFYRISYHITPVHKTAHCKCPIFEAVLFDGYIRLIYHATISALSAELAVIPSRYIRMVKPMATPPDGVGTGKQFLAGYNRSQTKLWTCSHYVALPD